MRQKLATRQINRKRERYREQRRKRFRFATIGIIAIFAFIFIIKPHIVEDNTAKADTAALLSEEVLSKRSYASTGLVQEELVDKPEEEYTPEEKGYSDELLSYKKVKEAGLVYKEKNAESKKTLEVKPGEYVKFYGLEDGWAKISHRNTFGFIRSDLLEKTSDDTMVVRKGILYVDKDHMVASDFEGGFDLETENSLLIAIEAMKREGLEIGVGRKYTTFEEEKNYITNSETNYPNPDEYTSELRTGYAVEIHSLKKDPRIEHDFFSTKEGEWVKNNIHNYGFVIRYPESKEEITGFRANQHILRYVGVENAQYMFENNLTMEEYFK